MAATPLSPDVTARMSQWQGKKIENVAQCANARGK
jgi:hypothetical protein